MTPPSTRFVLIKKKERFVEAVKTTLKIVPVHSQYCFSRLHFQLSFVSEDSWVYLVSNDFYQNASLTCSNAVSCRDFFCSLSVADCLLNFAFPYIVQSVAFREAQFFTSRIAIEDVKLLRKRVIDLRSKGYNLLILIL